MTQIYCNYQLPSDTSTGVSKTLNFLWNPYDIDNRLWWNYELIIFKTAMLYFIAVLCTRTPWVCVGNTD
jgi:hypothetical protein